MRGPPGAAVHAAKQPSRHWTEQRGMDRFLTLRRELRREATEAESALWALLRGRQLVGFKFRRQYSCGSYILDFFCPARRLAIELDGGQHFDPKAEVYDQRRTASSSGVEYRCSASRRTLSSANERRSSRRSSAFSCNLSPGPPSLSPLTRGEGDQPQQLALYRPIECLASASARLLRSGPRNFPACSGRTWW